MRVSIWFQHKRGNETGNNRCWFYIVESLWRKKDTMNRAGDSGSSCGRGENFSLKVNNVGPTDN